MISRRLKAAVFCAIGFVLSSVCASKLLAPGVSCGGLLPAVAAHCGHPDFSGLKGCCDALTIWNKAGCWCEPSALGAIVRIATNEYGFTGRIDKCNIDNPLRPRFQTRQSIGEPSTCPSTFVSVPANARGEASGDGKACSVAPSTLRERRLKTLKALDSLHLTSDEKEDVARFRKTVADAVSDHASFINVGQISLFGKSDLTDYLMSRQKASGSTSPLLPGSKRENMFWREHGIVSYSLPIRSPKGLYLTRYMFIGFEACSPKARSVYISESLYTTALFSQFFYPRGKDGIIGQFDIDSKTLCDRIASSCTGKLFPYESVKECKNTFGDLKKKRKLMCNRFKQAYVPQLAIHGNSIACRATFAGVAKFSPEKYCPLIGKVGAEICAETSCPLGLYEDMLAPENPRHYGSGGAFKCTRSSGKCVEDWPSA